MGIMITDHGYNNWYNNPVYNAHKNVGAHYTWQNTVNRRKKYLTKSNTHP